MTREKFFFVFLLGWNGLISRPARSLAVGVGFGLLVDKAAAFVFGASPIPLLFIATIAGMLFGFYFRPSGQAGSSGWAIGSRPVEPETPTEPVTAI